MRGSSALSLRPTKSVLNRGPPCEYQSLEPARAARRGGGLRRTSACYCERPNWVQCSAERAAAARWQRAKYQTALLSDQQLGLEGHTVRQLEIDDSLGLDAGGYGQPPLRGPASKRRGLVAWTLLLALPVVMFLSLPAMAQTTYQPNTDRRSETDYEEFVMGRPNPQLCLDACLNSAPCRSWTFVNNPDGSADCRLGNHKQQPVADSCCTSGTR